MYFLKQIMMKSFRLIHFRRFSSKLTCNSVDWEFYCDPKNYSYIAQNVLARKLPCKIMEVIKQLKEIQNSSSDPAKVDSLKENLMPQLEWFPNKMHPNVLENKSEEPVMVKKCGKRPEFTYFPTKFEHLTKHLNVLRTRYLGHMSGNRSYYLKGDLALLEHALVRFAVSKLIKNNYQLVSVPDIIPRSIIEGCGMNTNNVHSQIYHVDNNWADDMCLSGTSEMALASLNSSKTFDFKFLPLKFCAVSRCYRAEAKRHQKEKGIYRVHEFTKVEMFGITANETGKESEEFLNDILNMQEEIFSDLGLYFKILEMPPCDLGLPAYHKYDIEAWVPTEKSFGEISSASNCTDYQSRRLDIKYMSPNNELKYCHTVNGTAAAIPRLLIAIFENLQNLNGSINIPEPLQKYLKKDVIQCKFNEKMLCTKPTK